MQRGIEGGVGCFFGVNGIVAAALPFAGSEMEEAAATGLDPKAAAIRARRATAGAKPFDAALTAT